MLPDVEHHVGRWQIRSQIKLTTRRELAEAISRRYRTVDRSAKKLILDEFTKATGYHRKHAIRILTTWPTVPPAQRPTSRIYGAAVKQVLVLLWEAADCVGGKRLKALLPQLIEAMERHQPRAPSQNAAGCSR